MYDGGVEDDSTVYLNVVAHKDKVSYKEVEDEFKDQATKHGWKFESFKYSSDMVDSIVDDDNCALVVYFKKVVKIDEENLENELNKGDDGWKEIGQPVGEAKVAVDANDVWSVLELLDDEKAKKNLTDLINSHVCTEDEIMDAIDTFVEKNWSNVRLSKRELNKTFSNWMSDIVQELGLDVNKFKETGEFVEKGKPTSVELESGGGEHKFKVGDEITWRHHNGSLSNEIVRKLVDGGYEVEGGHAGENECYPGHVPEDLLNRANMEWDGKEWKQGIGMAEGTDDQKPDEVKGGEKKYKQDGETKTLVTGSDKQKVNEMTIEQEIDNPWRLLELLWGQGKENFEDLLRSGAVDEDYVMQMLEDMELRNLTSINDAFAYDFPSMLDAFGLDGEAWSQNLEIKRKGDDSED